MEMISNMNGTHYDELIVGTAVPVLTKNVTLKGVTASYKRGTLLALVGGKYEIVDSTASESGADKASVILANDIVLSGTDVVTTVYISGQFNREKLIVAQTSDNATAHEEELRAVNIYLTSVK
ncbi:head decoration protein [Phascolarctobacterium faecium]|jgi:hypothetical protein|uniref:head decoration protein n=1 Tax=Phascolarctobacterium faecium TaxID=33025 RepID=UPI0027BA744A|nr:head decoration protein [Phascolarctobacterium faecium]